MMEEKLKIVCWEILKLKVEAKAFTTNAFSTSYILKEHLKPSLSCISSCKNRVAQDCPLRSVNYDWLISNLEARSTADREQSENKLNEARQKLILIFVGTKPLEMNWWRMYIEEKSLGTRKWNSLGHQIKKI